MKGSKLVQVLSKLSKFELKRFDKFIKSPFFYEGKRVNDLSALFFLIQKASPQFSEKKLHKHYIYEKLFPNQDFKKGKLEKLMTELYSLLETFISYQNTAIPQNRNEQLLALSKFFREKNIDNLFWLNIKKLKNVLNSQKIKSQSLYRDAFLIEQEEVLYYGGIANRPPDLNLPTTLKALDVYYLSTKLEYSIWLLARSIHAHVDFDEATFLLDKVITEINNQAHLNIPTLLVYKQAYLLLKKYSEDHLHEFLELTQKLEEYKAEIDPEQLKVIHTLLRIYAVGQYNQGKNEYLSEVFELFKKHLKMGYLYYDGKIFSNNMMNIVVFGLRSREETWVLNFLNEHRHRITGTQFPEDVYHFNLANYYFYLKKYDKSLKLLEGTYEEMYYKIAARRLEIKIYFEQKSPLLESRIEAFKVYLFRLSSQQFSNKHKIGNNAFIDLLKQIIHPKTYKNEIRIDKLKQKVKAKKVLAEKDWLLKTIQSLSDKNDA